MVCMYKLQNAVASMVIRWENGMSMSRWDGKNWVDIGVGIDGTGQTAVGWEKSGRDRAWGRE